LKPAFRRKVVGLFDRYIAVDWSAANTPKTGADSIWIGEAQRTGDVVRRRPSRNPPTRSAAMADICDTLAKARANGERVMLGFDFVFGYPAGAAKAIAGEASWRALWRKVSALIEDSDSNLSNRFEVAARINSAITGDCPRYYGHPNGRSIAGLTLKRPEATRGRVRDRRLAEARVKGPQPVWKLIGVGSVGSQTMLGIARLETLRGDPCFVDEIAIWPFETEFERALKRPITVVEIYPSLFDVPVRPDVPRDRLQVEVAARRFAELDATGDLVTILSAPADLSTAEREAVLKEEGWIAGIACQDVLRGRA
jgi:precorrin-8X/cobalt-precorrin-8 methylmutase